MKICFFSHQANFIYGGEISTLAFMRGIKRLGHRVSFVSPEGIYLERAKTVTSETFVIPSIQFNKSFYLAPKLLKSVVSVRARLKKWFAKEKPDILHATSLKSMVYCSFVGHENIIWHHHDILPDSRANRFWVRFLAKKAKKILVPSQATKKSLLSMGVEREKVDVLNNGFSLEAWHPRPSRKSKRILVSLVGELSYRKGIDRLGQICKELERLGKLGEVDFQVVGGELSEPDYAARVRLDLKPFPIHFLGRREDIAEVLQQTDVLLVPSRQDPYPTVIIEAALSGVPTVGARVGGIPEMIQEGETGFLCENEVEMAEALARFTDQVFWLKTSSATREFAEQIFDSAKLSKQLEGIYGSILV